MVESLAKLHHYVPQFLLRQFGTGKKKHVCVFDKHSGRDFVSSTKRVAAENGLYDFFFEGIPVTQEHSLAKLEDKAATIIKRVIEGRNVSAISTDDKTILAIFMSVQMVRTNAARAQFRHIGNMLADWIRESADGDAKAMEAAEEYIGERTENDEKMEAARLIYSAPEMFAPALLEKVWTLAEAAPGANFWIGDNAIAMSNSIDRWPRGNIGVSVPGIEIYLPISPKLQLCLYCRSLVTELEEARSAFISPSMPDRLADAVRTARRIMDCIDTGSPCPYSPENVDYVNSLQVIYAERYVIGATNRFEMVREMIESDPTLRHGRRGERGPLSSPA